MEKAIKKNTTLEKSLSTPHLKIEIRPIANRNKIQDFSKDIEFYSNTRTVVLCPFVNPRTRTYNTGLSEDDKEYLKIKNCPYNLDEQFTQGVPHEFWESSLVKMELKNTPIFLSPYENIIDFIKWKYLLKSKYIYTSEANIKIGDKPEATHFIYNESEETVIKASAIQIKTNLLRKVDKLNLNKKREIILILNNEDMSLKSEDYILVKMDEIVNNKTKSAQLTALLEESTTDISIKAKIKAAINKNILRKTKKGIFYADINIGFTELDVLKYFQDVTNQELLTKITEKI